MGTFNLDFGIDLNYSDPDYRFIVVKANGEAEVSCDGRDGSEQDKMLVTDLIKMGLMDTFLNLSQENISYKDISSHNDEIISAVKEKSAASGVTVTSLRLADVVPDERSSERIKKLEEMQRISKMTPEELAKFQQEKMEEAKRTWEVLSPEEKARIEAENKKRADEAVESMRKAQELARKMAASGDATGAKAASVTADMAAMKAAALGGTAVAAMPKFCSNCGAPNKGGKFCSNCGKQF